MPSLFKLLPDDEPKFIKRKQQVRPAMSGIELYPSLVDPDYKLPSEFPRLSDYKSIAFDIETRDVSMQNNLGPGDHDPQSFITGVSISTEDFSEYYPVRHYGENLDEQTVVQYLKDNIIRKDLTIVGQNIVYDLAFLEAKWGIVPQGKILDTMVMDSILDPTHDSYKLDAILKRHGFEGKKPEKMEAYAKQRGWRGNAVSWNYKMPASIVSEYGIADTNQLIPLARKMYNDLKCKDQIQLMHVENDLLKFILKMRAVGALVDVKQAEKYYETNLIKINEMQTRLGNYNVNSTQDLQRLFDSKGYVYKRTAKGNPSFKDDFLNEYDYPEVTLIKDIRYLTKLNDTFIKGVIIDKNIDGKIYSSFKTIKTEDGGTRTGRMSSSDPNLQQSHGDKDYRAIFIAPENHYFGSIDLSSVQARVVAAYAKGDGSDELRKAYKNNPDLDLYQHSCDILNSKGIQITRQETKQVILAGLFGQGIQKLADKLSIEYDEAKVLRPKVFETLSFIKNTIDHYARIVENTGVIRSVLGRERTFTEWEIADWNLKKKLENSKGPLKRGAGVFSSKEDIQAWLEKNGMHSPIKRAYGYRGINTVAQQIESDLFKKSLVDALHAGVFDVLMPSTVIHDEQNSYVPKTKEGYEAFKELKWHMENSIDIGVPITTSAKLGENWAEVH